MVLPVSSGFVGFTAATISASKPTFAMKSAKLSSVVVSDWANRAFLANFFTPPGLLDLGTSVTQN